MIFDPRSSIVKDVFDCHLSSVILVTKDFETLITTQVNRMSRSQRVLATGGKQRVFGLDMVWIKTILFH